MPENNILPYTCYLVEPIVIKYIAIKRQSISLPHLHTSESIKGITGLIEKRTVTIHQRTLMVKLDIAD